MATQTSNLNSQMQHKDSLFPSVYTSILYSLNNFSYRLQNFSFSGLIQQLADSSGSNTDQSTHFLMGNRIRNFRQCIQAQKDLIFFSYRKNFKLTETVTSDFGWGCLLRVGQMALAQALRLHFQYQQIKVPNSQIIQSFLQTDESTAKYSIQKLTKQAKILWNKAIGQWYSQIQMLSVVQEIHKQNPMKGAQNLSIKIYSESLDLNQLKKQLLSSEQRESEESFEVDQFHSFCDNTLQILENQIDLTKAIYKPKTTQQQKKTILVVVNTKLGDKTVNEKEFNQLLTLMELPIFMGCIAGVKGKAKFITGKQNKNISYFDPHLVQQAQFNGSNQLNTESYVCKDYLLMSKDKLHSQISVCFFIKDLKDLNILKAGIDQIRSSQQAQYQSRFIDYRQPSLNSDKVEPKTKFITTNSQQIQILEQDYGDSQSFTDIL